MPLKADGHRASRHAALVSIAALLAVMAVWGCSVESNPNRSTTRNSDAALKDPFGDWSKVDTNISGSKVGEHPEKSTWREDLDRMLLR